MPLVAYMAAILIGLSAVGLPLRTHFCGGVIADVSPIWAGQSCAQHHEVVAACGVHSAKLATSKSCCGQSDATDDCCSDELTWEHSDHKYYADAGLAGTHASGSAYAGHSAGSTQKLSVSVVVERIRPPPTSRYARPTRIALALLQVYQC